jgi:Domain of unknown function (DUF4269)
VIDDWYPRLQATGLLDSLAPYEPVVVGSYPLGVAGPDSRLEIVCRAVDMPAFARTMERAYGEREGFALHPGSLDLEDAVFAEFELDGLQLEVAAQPQHVHRSLGAATMGVSRVLQEEGDVSRVRLAAAVAHGDDWLDAAMAQTGLTRAALESLAGASPQLVRRVLGVDQQGPPLRTYLVPVVIGFVSQVLIVLATTRRGADGNFTGLMVLVEAIILGAVFGVRLGVVAALLPLVVVGVIAGGGELLSAGASPDTLYTLAGYVFVAVLVGGGAFTAGSLRDRYFPRAGPVQS